MHTFVLLVSCHDKTTYQRNKCYFPFTKKIKEQYKLTSKLHDEKSSCNYFVCVTNFCLFPATNRKFIASF